MSAVPESPDGPDSPHSSNGQQPPVALPVEDVLQPIHAEIESDYGEPSLVGNTISTSTLHSDAEPIALEPLAAEPIFQQTTFAHPPRTPTLLDTALFLAILILGLLFTTALLGVALHFHWLERWLGIRDFQSAANDTRLALGTQFLIYLIGLGAAVPLFRAVWHRGYLAGLHWRGQTALRLRWRLIAAAVGCNVLAIVGNAVLPFPDHAPIDKMFSTARDAWLLTIFGVLLAPFFEEMIFRGFLLPAMATAWDWCAERLTSSNPLPLDAEGQPQWSIGAQVFAALVVSAPFALMHSAQVGAAWGPVSLLYCVSLVLCAVRLLSRSLAASTLVHATYNFFLFAAMFVQSSGFQHLDKM